MKISIDKISKTFGQQQVLQQVSLSVSAGEVCGLLGLNGAGKSTLFKILFGLLKANSGKVIRPEGAVKAIGGIIEKPALYEYLSARDNLRQFASIQGAPHKDSDLEYYLERVGLDASRKDVVKNYSMGMKQRLAIAVALLNDPPFLVLDEPFSGLDPLGVRKLSRLIRQLAGEKGIGVLLSSHLVDEMIRTCDRIYVLNDGKIVRESTPEEMVSAASNSYLITGQGLHESEALREEQAEFSENWVRVAAPKNGIASLLTALHREDARVVSCVPETDMDVLLSEKDD